MFEKPYKESRTIRKYECDFHGNLKADVLLNLMEECFENQMRLEGFSNDKLRTMGQALLVNEMDFEIKDSCEKGDVLEFETFPYETVRAIFPRAARVYKGDKLIATSLSQWTVVDLDKRKILRESPVTDGFYKEEYSGKLPKFIRVKNSVDYEKVGEYQVAYTNLDKNGHMNNVEHLSLALNYIPELLQGYKIKKIKMHFVKEVLNGEKLSIFEGKEKGIEGMTYYFYLDNSKSINSIIEIEIIQ
ncbi:MAG: thioesterase [Clostridia bacterium]|nr:thioesterase [Clostridia bacterium]